VTDNVQELDLPPEVLDADWATEILRFWIADGVDYLSRRINAVQQEGGEHHGASIWGSILADITRHVVNAFSQDVENGVSREQILALIERGYAERLVEKFDASIVGDLKGKANAH
jgi:hypothetical protein